MLQLRASIPGNMLTPLAAAFVHGSPEMRATRSAKDIKFSKNQNIYYIQGPRIFFFRHRCCCWSCCQICRYCCCFCCCLCFYHRFYGVVATVAAAEAAAVAAAPAAAPAAASVSEENDSWTLNIISFLVFAKLSFARTNDQKRRKNVQKTLKS